MALLNEQSSVGPQPSKKRKSPPIGRTYDNEKGLHFRSNLVTFQELVKSLQGRVPRTHIEEVERTPFGKLFMAFYRDLLPDNLTKSNMSIKEIVRTYDRNKNAFRFGRKYVELKVEDVALTFGMPIKGMELRKKYGSVKKTEFVRRHFAGVIMLKKSLIEDAIKKTTLIRTETAAKDFAKLVGLCMAANIFFANTKSDLSWYIADHIVDEQKCYNTSWPEAIHKNLMDSVRKFTQEGSQKTTNISGCTVLLPYFFCEHVDLIKPKQGLERAIPRAVRWDLELLSKKLEKNFIRLLKGHRVLVELRDIRNTERDLLGLDHVKESLEIGGPSLLLLTYHNEDREGKETSNEEEGDDMSVDVSVEKGEQIEKESGEGEYDAEMENVGEKVVGDVGGETIEERGETEYAAEKKCVDEDVEGDAEGDNIKEKEGERLYDADRECVIANVGRDVGSEEKQTEGQSYQVAHFKRPSDAAEETTEDSENNAAGETAENNKEEEKGKASYMKLDHDEEPSERQIEKLEKRIEELEKIKEEFDKIKEENEKLLKRNEELQTEVERLQKVERSKELEKEENGKEDEKGGEEEKKHRSYRRRRKWS